MANFFDLRSFMRRNRDDIWHLASPGKGLSYEGTCHFLLGTMMILPVKLENGPKKQNGTLLLFSQNHWQVMNRNWQNFSYTGKHGVESILILAKEDESEEELILRTKVLVFRFMRPTHLPEKDASWKKEEWISGTIYQPPHKQNVVRVDFQTDGLPA